MFARFDLSALFRRSAKFVWAILAVVVAITLLTFTARAWRDKKRSAANSVTKNRLLPHSQGKVSSPPIGQGYVRPGLLQPPLREALRVLGDRLVKPGKERQVLVGTIEREDHPNPVPVRVLMELPNRLRVEEAAGAQARVLTFNDGAMSKGGGINRLDKSLVESLVYDTAEHFFGSQMQGLATRFVGGRFRIDSGSSNHYSGPYYDIYHVADQIKYDKSVYTQPKYYYINSDTLLLERVTYSANVDGENIKIQTEITDWQKVGGHLLPKRIVRSENNRPTLTLKVSSAAVTQKLADGAFTP